ncbi:MAG: hypothetical protein ABI270_05250 [Nitrosospira sp.]
MVAPNLTERGTQLLLDASGQNSIPVEDYVVAMIDIRPTPLCV